MKKFLIRLSLFTVLILVLASVLDLIVTNLLQKSRQLDYGVWNDILHGKVNSDIVINGSSKAWVQVNTAIIEERFKTTAYNIGLDAFGFNMQHCRHRLLLKYNKSPKLIIHVVDVNMFDDDSVLYNKNQFLPYLNNDIINHQIQSYDGLNLFDKNIPFYRYVGEQATLKHASKILLRPDLNQPDKYRGFAGQHLGWTDDYANARKQYPDGILVQVYPVYVNLFKSYIADCIRRKIKIVVVYSPEFKAGQNFQRNSGDVLQLIENIASEYGIPFLNFRSDRNLEARKYYYNNNHLNAEGADIFTNLLCDKLEKNTVEINYIKE